VLFGGGKKKTKPKKTPGSTGRRAKGRSLGGGVGREVREAVSPHGLLEKKMRLWFGGGEGDPQTKEAKGQGLRRVVTIGRLDARLRFRGGKVHEGCRAEKGKGRALLRRKRSWTTEEREKKKGGYSGVARRARKETGSGEAGVTN